jgi:hypothetical protein
MSEDDLEQLVEHFESVITQLAKRIEKLEHPSTPPTHIGYPMYVQANTPVGFRDQWQQTRWPDPKL